MKKLLGILVLGLVFSLNIFDAKATFFKKGQTYEGEVIFERVKYQLPPGKWEVIEKWGWSWNIMSSKGVDLIQLEGKTLKAAVSLYVFDSGGKYIGYMNQWLYKWVFMDKHDGCYSRSEYYLVKAFKHGAAFNCFRVRHIDIKKELYQPDDPKDKVWSAMWRKYLRENNVKLPPITVSSNHIYYAPVVQNKMISYWYAIDPEFHGGR